MGPEKFVVEKAFKEKDYTATKREKLPTRTLMTTMTSVIIASA